MMKFSPFWNMMSERNISIYQLEYEYNLNPAEISRLKNNHNFTLKSIDKYCNIFACDIDDIVEYKNDEYE